MATKHSHGIHDSGLGAVLLIFPVRELAEEWSFRIALIGAAFAASIAFFGGKSLDAVVLVAGFTISVAPAILGVVIAGYSIVVARDPGKDSIPDPGKPYSLYQRLNAKFVLAVVVLALGLSLGMVVNYVAVGLSNVKVGEVWASMVNTTTVALLAFFSAYGICICVSAAKTIFSLGQMLNIRARVKIHKESQQQESQK